MLWSQKILCQQQMMKWRIFHPSTILLKHQQNNHKHLTTPVQPPPPPSPAPNNVVGDNLVHGVVDPVTQVAHQRSWLINETALRNKINGPIPHCLWYVSNPLGESITQNDTNKMESMSTLDIFLIIIPPEQLTHIIQQTNRNLRKQGQCATTKGEIVWFFGIIILGTKFAFGVRRDLWATISKSSLVESPRFGEKTGMGRGRFDNL